MKIKWKRALLRNIPSTEVKEKVKVLLREWKNIKEEVGFFSDDIT